ncbi:conserved unknown protein [Ectocarpus siliculosus]|uniref:Cdc23 domain-containing protein n=1 Tax=Ectocarpus siliculosus TaxID=2880 RepID=D7G4Y9_ECTSI|nr:conserved unknown protein [Ectocarpus siliculosus]|eukprot:CBJ33752.1 conserved unknown protein [Ectocarpus siliculosus]
MDVGEFERASQAFGNKSWPAAAAAGSVPGGLYSRARFLGWYSLFLAGERRREEESQLTDALQRRRLVNPHLKTLHAELSQCDQAGTLDAFGLYMPCERKGVGVQGAREEIPQPLERLTQAVVAAVQILLVGVAVELS